MFVNTSSTSSIRLLLVLTLLSLGWAASTAPTWTPTTTLQTSSSLNNSEMISMITSSGSKANLFSVSHSPAFTATPKMFLGAYKIDSPAGTTQEWLFHILMPSKTGFYVGYLVGGSTTINSMNIYSMAVDSSISYIYVTLNVDFTGSCILVH